MSHGSGPSVASEGGGFLAERRRACCCCSRGAMLLGFTALQRVRVLERALFAKREKHHGPSHESSPVCCWQSQGRSQ